VALPGLAAERIEFFYGPFEITLGVEDLQHFADTGEVRGSLRPIAGRLTPEQLASLRAVLNRPFPLDVVTVSELTYSPVGARLLGQMGELVQTDAQQNGFLALRASLILAAAQEPGLTPMHVVQQFPLDTMQINYGLAQRLLGDSQQFFQQQEAVLAALEAQAQNNPAAIAPGSPEQPGEFVWQKRTIAFANPLRQTPPVADLYLPTLPVAGEPQSLPVVVISHGASSNRQSFGYLAAHLAAHGYAAVVLEHEDNGAQFEQFLSGLAQPPDPITLLSRPLDVTAVLDALEDLAQDEPQLRSLNLAQVGVVGHSLGGYTALAVAGATLSPETLRPTCPSATQRQISLNLSLLVQCELLEVDSPLPTSLRDPRVSSAIAISPLSSHIFGQVGLGQVQIPVLMVAATEDYFTPALPEQIQPFGWLASPQKHLVVVRGGTHFSFLQGSASGSPLPLPEGFLGPDPSLAHPYLKGLSVAFFDRHQRGQPEADRYLSQGYLDSLAQDPLRALIVRELPAAEAELQP
jgi:predicted dienelactone hydrolase